MKYEQGFKQFVVLEQSSLDVIVTKKIYIDMVDDLAAGILLSQIVYWHLPSQETGRSKLTVFHKGHYWLAKGRDDWHDEIRLSPKQVDRAMKILKGFDLVEVIKKKWNGSPTMHIRLKQDNFMSLIKKYQQKLVDEFELSTGEIDDEPMGDMVFTQMGNSNLPKGENGNHPKGKKEFPQTVNSITENTTETTPNNTFKDYHSSLSNMSEDVIFLITETCKSFGYSEREIIEILKYSSRHDLTYLQAKDVMDQAKDMQGKKIDAPAYYFANGLSMRCEKKPREIAQQKKIEQSQQGYERKVPFYNWLES